MANRPILNRSAIKGQFYIPGQQSTPILITEGTITVTPCDWAEPVSIDQLLCEVTTVGTAGAVTRLGVYLDDGTFNRPGELLLDAGTVTTDVLGVRTLALGTPLTIPAGRCYFVTAAQGAPATQATMRALLVFDSRIALPSISGLFQNTITRGGITGALPATLSGFLPINYAVGVGMRFTP